MTFCSLKKSSLYLPLFSKYCKEGFEAKKSPLQIVQEFFETYGLELNEQQFEYNSKFFSKEHKLMKAISNSEFNDAF